MPCVRIVHWKAEEARALIEATRNCGVEVEYDAVDFPTLSKMIHAHPPDVILFDLTRRPSHSREAAAYLRRTKYARQIPFIFVDGEPEKVESVRALLPDAVCVSRRQLGTAIRRASKDFTPVLPPTMEERYAGRTVAQKLGIKEGMPVGVIDAPRNYAAVIGDLPKGAELLEDAESVQPLTLWFVTDPRACRAGIRRIRSLAAHTKLWIIWRKGLNDGLTDKLVREIANEAGLVDYKICALHEQWSGMAFARRKS
jgi:CheY-like chemotaxis protein